LYEHFHTLVHVTILNEYVTFYLPTWFIFIC